MLNLQSLQLDITGWTLHQEQAESALWFDTESDFIGVNLFNTQPDIPAPCNGSEPLRNYFREITRAQGGGIVEVDVVRIHNIACASLITKTPQTPTGCTYKAGLIIPRQFFSFVIRVEALERGFTGSRDVAVMLLEDSNLQTEPVVEEEYVEHPIFGRVLKAGKIIGWTKDPYEPQFDNIALFNLSDQQKYDANFPDSPLSRVRRKLTHIINTVQFGGDIINAVEFRDRSF
jgi:hypothetical protein